MNNARPVHVRFKPTPIADSAIDGSHTVRPDPSRIPWDARKKSNSQKSIA
jgi:hypothetical protein